MGAWNLNWQVLYLFQITQRKNRNEQFFQVLQKWNEEEPNHNFMEKIRKKRRHLKRLAMAPSSTPGHLSHFAPLLGREQLCTLEVLVKLLKVKHFLSQPLHCLYLHQRWATSNKTNFTNNHIQCWVTTFPGGEQQTLPLRLDTLWYGVFSKASTRLVSSYYITIIAL